MANVYISAVDSKLQVLIGASRIVYGFISIVEHGVFIAMMCSISIQIMLIQYFIICILYVGVFV